MRAQVPMRKTFDTPISARTRWMLHASMALTLLAFLSIVVTRRFICLALVWNLFLAWVPYAVARWTQRLAERSEHGTGRLVVPTLLWLLFFPNAPYVVTDLVHLRNVPVGWIVPGAVLIGAFAALAMALGLYSLRDMHTVVRRRLGPSWGWAFAATTCLLAGVGVWMGRFLRWNSWDAVTQPLAVLDTTLERLTTDVGALAFASQFGLGLLALYWFTLGRHTEGGRAAGTP